MSASGPPLCRICQKEHWMRDPHILPTNAPAEKRAKRPQIIATYTPPTPAPEKAKTRTKADKVTPGKRKTAPKAKKRKGKKK